MNYLQEERSVSRFCTWKMLWRTLEAIARLCSVKKVLLKIPQNSQENICARVSF